jgi:beta-N-acetylhexosaminidase
MTDNFDSTALTPRQMAGQRLMLGFNGIELDDELRYLIDTLCVGGVVLFSRNIESPFQLKKLCGDMARHARRSGQAPLIIAVDQEGGPVARLKNPFSEFAGNPGMTGKTDADEFATVTAMELGQVGINMNLAPVMDVAFRPKQSIMRDRAFSSRPTVCAELGCTVIDRMQQNGVMAIAKHFPGIGRTRIDSHVAKPVSNVTANTLERVDLVPFKAAIDRSVAGIMLGHVIYSNIDPDWPASLSPAIASGLLRRQLGYSGVTLTDDLDMTAAKDHASIQRAMRQIVAAEVDLVLICHRGPNQESAHKKLMRIAEKRASDRDRCRASVGRILSLKKAYLDES